MDLDGFGENARLCTQTVSQTDRQLEKHTAHKMKPVYPFNFVWAEGLIKLLFPVMGFQLLLEQLERLRSEIPPSPTTPPHDYPY